ncbi:MAG: tetratricopeptide repeat protein [Phycisphaerales bacterium]|nr:MAG: tetratricopeptide repeat protein [Phycisphaerales bacterium]
MYPSVETRNGVLVCVIAMLMFSCAATDRGGTDAQVQLAGTGERFSIDLGDYQRDITTESDEAQQWFNRGLIWLYAFNHDEAVRSFERALEHDSDCAMAWWGIAYACGPHINKPIMSEEESAAAYRASREALDRIDRASRVERALIRAVAARYAMPAPEDRTQLDQTHAELMEQAWRNFPNDPDVGALYAESLMNLQPWDLWTRDGEPKGRTEEIVTVLERVLEIDDHHPGANHFYIHAAEASPEPERALAAAERLPELVPGAGHLVHMPSHIYARLGQWAKASDANAAALEADLAYFEVAPEPPAFYNIYYLHNHHFLAWSATMEGRFETALQAARSVEQEMPEEFLREYAFVADGLMPITLHVLIRFGKWERVLEVREPEDFRHVSRAHWRYARTLALANLGRVPEAREELEKFEEEAAKIPEHWEISFNPAREVIKIARLMAKGEMAYHDDRVDDAFAYLREAVELEDSLRYAEPPAWPHPVRHALGALLHAEGKYAEAERVFQRDLERYPDNGWALLGLQQALEGQGKTEQARHLESQLDLAWARADVQPVAACFCHPAAHEEHRQRHGVVNFPVSCSEQAQDLIEKGLAHLHHMMYEQARPYFQAAATIDDDCVMAHWGVAMTSFQPLWHPTPDQDLARGKRAFERALEIGPPTERERGYINAVKAFFTDPEPPAESRADDHEARVKAWKTAQRKLHEAHPDDVDAAAFYALAEVCYAMTQFSPAREHDYERERLAGALLEKYLEDHPKHPGLFHYLIHAYDSTELAPKAETIAREYDQLAPDSVHALHMPSHIFVRLGHWEETAEWNERSADAAARIMHVDQQASAHYVHALDYMMYGYLQLEDNENASKTLDRVRNVEEIWPAHFAGYNTAATQVRYYLEQHKWEDAANMPVRIPETFPWDDFPKALALFHFARGLGAARIGNVYQADEEHERIKQAVQQLRDQGDRYWAYMAEALGKAVKAWTLYERGETEDAVALMRDAAELEDSMDKHPTTPGEVLPIYELLGDMLHQLGRADEAIEAYEASLKRTPNRRNAIKGIERAKAAQ